MIRKIIRIDKEKCNGCGACATACHEGAIDIINGKAELVREHFCDGLPTANGKPHIGHVLTRVIKDMIPRYRTMKGYMVPRKAGWDTHGLPWNFVSLHCTVSWDHILDNTCQNVSDVRFSVGCRRTVVEHIDLVAFTVTHTFSEDVIVFPEFLCLFFSVYKIKIRRNFLIHIYLHKIKTLN